MTIRLSKDLYTAHATATGGREGHSATDDGLVNVDLALPKEMGGAGGATSVSRLPSKARCAKAWGSSISLPSPAMR